MEPRFLFVLEKEGLYRAAGKKEKNIPGMLNRQQKLSVGLCQPRAKTAERELYILAFASTVRSGSVLH